MKAIYSVLQYRPCKEKINSPFLEKRILLFRAFFLDFTPYRRKHRPGLPPTKTKEIPDFSVTVKQFSLTLQDDYSGHEQTKLIIIFIKDNFKNDNLRKPKEKIP